jgi:hypothetical protein
VKTPRFDWFQESTPGQCSNQKASGSFAITLRWALAKGSRLSLSNEIHDPGALTPGFNFAWQISNWIRYRVIECMTRKNGFSAVI